jgi:drug/metabolite transporter (DMT)-like permease
VGGVGLAVLSAALFGTGQVARKAGLEVMPGALLGAAVGTCVALLAFLALSAVRGQVSALVNAGFGRFRGYYWLAGIGSTVGQLGFFAAAARAPVSQVSVIVATETVLTILIARLLVGSSETVTARVIAAAACVFGGALVIALS